MPLRTTRQRIQHLLRRTGFGYSAAELEQYVALGLDGSVARLLAPEQVSDDALNAALQPVLAPFAGDPKNPDIEPEQRAALFQAWYLRLATSNRPLVERMTYFWHDHFATAISKVGRPVAMQRQNEVLRAGALGPFGDLLLSVARDPAMLVYLDNRSNAKGAPNENYARELFELHTLGEGNGYTELDIKEAARALTGWRLSEDGSSMFRANLFDAGRKTILGRSSAFNDEGLVTLLAGQPGTAAYIADKLVRFFVRPDGAPELASRAAEKFSATNGTIREVLRVILSSDEMYSDAAYRSMVKSPTEIVVGVRRALEMPVLGQVEAQTSRRMGQTLFDPPNPAGWTGGVEWINGTTVLTRSNFASETTSLRGKATADVPGLLWRHGVTASAAVVVDWLLDLLVGGDVDVETRAVLIDHIGGADHFNFEKAAKEGRLHGVAYLILAMPLYQVA